MGYDTVSIATNTAVMIVAENVNRHSIIITNIGTGAAFVAPDASVTSANGTKIITNGSITEDSGGAKIYYGAYYAIAGSVGTTVTYWERTR
jgi:hypothetical protein